MDGGGELTGNIQVPSDPYKVLILRRALRIAFLQSDDGDEAELFRLMYVELGGDEFNL